MKKKTKQILAILAIVIIVAMYAATLIFSLIKSPAAQTLFRASLACTFLVPVIIYVIILVARTARPSRSPVIDTLIFDVGHVLMDFSWQDYLKNMGLSEGALDVFFKTPSFNDLWHEFDLGNLSDEEIRQRYKEAFPEYEEDILRFIDGVPECFIPFDYTFDMIASLKNRGYKLYILSNMPKFLYDKAHDCGDMAFENFMDGAYWSYRVHMTKPDERIYRSLIKEYKIDPKKAVFIDDMEKNTTAAKAEGLGAITFTSYSDLKTRLGDLGVKW